MKNLKSQLCFIFIIYYIKISSTHKLSFDELRNSVIQTEEYLSTGGSIRLTPKESCVNKILLKYKSDDLLDGFNNPDNLASGIHFFKGKPLIEKSKVFKVLKLMPKGGLLHGHNAAMVSSEWVIKNLTYWPGLLKCVNKKGVIILSFRKSEYHECASDYVKVEDERARSKNSDFYDKTLEKSINLYTPRPEIEYSNINEVWNKFQNMFLTISDLLKYIPVYRAYHYRLLEEMYDDGIFYIEIRCSFAEGYGPNGSRTSVEMVKELINVVENFKKIHPDFIGVKAIFTTQRKLTLEQLLERIDVFLKIRTLYPDFIVGFDLVGQEDLGNSLYFFNEIIQSMPTGVRYFFHAGETNWYGAAADYNILDALLLNTTRIGHAYALVKHPVLWQSIKRRDIAIEINPISNQVLSLVRDLRNHPAAFYISENIPIVISNDDPGFWNAKGLSYDYYYSLMSFGSNRSGIKLLKKLVLNSLIYTTMTSDERYYAKIIFNKRWEQFLDIIIKYGLKGQCV